MLCVDASLVLMLLLPDEASEVTETLWARWEEDGTVILGPALLYAEVPSVLRRVVYLGRISREEGDQAFETFCNMGITVSARPDLHLIAWDLAKAHDRSRVYDSFYLAAAQAEGCDLWTGDRRLVNAVNLSWVKWSGLGPP